VLVKNTDNNVGRIFKAVLFGNPSLDKSCSEHTDQVVSASPSVMQWASYLVACFLLLVLHPWMKILVMLAHFWHSTWDCMFLALKHFIQREGHPFKFCSRAEEIDATARSGSDLSLHLDLLPCPQEPKYALHLRVSVVRIPDCLNSSFGGSEYQDMVDQALNEYFKFDRFLARDVFGTKTCCLFVDILINC
jgi:peroxin-6